MTHEAFFIPTSFIPRAQEPKRFTAERLVRFCTVLSTLLVTATAWATSCELGGEGTATDPFHLERALDFEAMPSCGLDKHYVVTRDINFHGSTPATANHTFSGHLSSISGTDWPMVMTNVTLTSVDEGYFGGFFQSLGGGASVRNLIFHDVTIVVRANGNDTGVGVLAGMTVEPGNPVRVSDVVVLNSSVSALDGSNPRTYEAPTWVG